MLLSVNLFFVVVVVFIDVVAQYSINMILSIVNKVDYIYSVVMFIR